MNAERMRRFLEFVVEHTLRTPEEPLKEVVVGLELYAAGGDFDPRISSVVRVDAARLRTKLREYYAADGAADALVIDLPKGSYTPVFRRAPVNGVVHPAEASIVVLPFSNLSPEPADYFSDGRDERVFDWLERSCRERIAWATYLATDRRFDPLRSHARFRSLLQRLRLPIITY